MTGGGWQPRTDLDWKKSIAKRLTYIERMSNARTSREAVVPIAALASGASATYSVVFDTPFPNDSYRIIVRPTPTSAAALGTYEAAMLPGSQTATGCTIMVKSTGGTVPSGQSVTVTGIR